MKNPLTRFRSGPSFSASARQQLEARSAASALQPEPDGAPGLQTAETNKKFLFRATTPAGLVLEWVSLVVPSLSVVTGLLFWFGWTFTNTRAAYFGLDYTALQFTTTDYLIRSAEAVFVPAAVLLLLFIAVLLLHGVVSALLRRSAGSKTILRWAAISTAAAGIAATASGVWAMFAPLPVDGYLMPPLLQGAGAAATAYSLSVLARLRQRSDGTAGDQRTQAAGWPLYCYSLVVMLVIVNLFWATSLYAAALGTGKAQELAQRLSSRPSVTLYSKQSMALGTPITEKALNIPEGVYQFKYTGLRLLIKSSGKYFLLSEGWTRKSGIALVLDDTSDIRLELEPGRGGK